MLYKFENNRNLHFYKPSVDRYLYLIINIDLRKKLKLFIHRRVHKGITIFINNIKTLRFES